MSNPEPEPTGGGMDTKTQLEKVLMPAFLKEKDHLDRIDRWFRWDHDKPHAPPQATAEYTELSERSQAPWLNLVVTTVAQALFADGYRGSTSLENAKPWKYWQANGMDGRQMAVHRAALAYGHSYVECVEGEDPLTGEKMPVMKGQSPRRMMTFYEDPANDDWASMAIKVEPHDFDNGGKGWKVRVYDDTNITTFTTDSFGADAQQVGEPEAHGAKVVPVVRFCNMLDLEGRTPGEVEPLIPIAGRIDQTAFDRLVVQRFASWIVRTIAGMDQPDEEAEAAAERLRLKVEDLLVAEDVDTKFGSLPATPLDGFIKAHEADIRVLAAVSQTPAHELLGEMANLSAEALAAARASLTAKVSERQHTFGESWEQALRLAAHIMGETEDAADVASEIRWADTEIRSLAQAADALGKLAQMLHVPVEALWEKIPGWTQADVERAKKLVEEGDALGRLAQELADQVDAMDTDDGEEPPVEEAA